MEPLAETVKKHGYDYFMVKRDGNVAMYSQFDGDHCVGYEVFIVKTVTATTWPNGTVSPEREMFPSDCNFGSTAFTSSSREMAETLFEKLKNGNIKTTENDDGTVTVEKVRRKRTPQPGVKKIIVDGGKITIYPDSKAVAMINHKLVSPKAPLCDFLKSKNYKNAETLTIKQMIAVIEKKFAGDLVD